MKCDTFSIGDKPEAEQDQESSDSSDSDESTSSNSSDDNEKTNNEENAESDSDSSDSSNSSNSSNDSDSSEDSSKKEDVVEQPPVAETECVVLNSASSYRQEQASHQNSTLTVTSNLFSRNSFSDCASEDGFEGFTSPMAGNRSVKEGSDTEKEDDQPQQQEVKISKETDSTESDNNTGSTDSESNSSASSTDSSYSDTDSQTDIEQKKSTEVQSQDQLTPGKDDSNSTAQHASEGYAKSTIEVNGLYSEVLQDSLHDNGAIIVPTIAVASSASGSNNSNLNATTGKFVLQSVEQMTKAAIGEVVDACSDDNTNSVAKLPSNVIKKIIDKQDGILIEGPSKLSPGNRLCAAKKPANVISPNWSANNNGNSNICIGQQHTRQDINICTVASASTSPATINTLNNRIINSSSKINMATHSNVSRAVTSHHDHGLDALTALANTAVTALKAQQQQQQLLQSVANARPTSAVEKHASYASSGNEGEEEESLPLPIQAEVVMSEGSDCEARPHDTVGLNAVDASKHVEDGCGNGTGQDTEDEQFKEYLQSYVGSNNTNTSTPGINNTLLQYHPSSNALPEPCPNLSQWQLDSVQLPAFVPSAQTTPNWIRLTIPPEGYKCNNCSDTFFLQCSVEAHMQRRSVLIRLECGPCDARLTFFNRCALREHLREHVLRGEGVDEDTVEVRSLPLHMTPLLQPYTAPVPRAHVTNSLDGRRTAPEQDGSSDLPPIHRCFMCERVFSSARQLMAHMRTDQLYSDRRVECRKCQLVLPSICAAKAHILTHPPANAANISVCPECGSACGSPRDFVHHINTCGHQFRRSGIICSACHICFFRSEEDFLLHWVKEHCTKNYECVVCHKLFESLVFHSCSAPGQQVLSTFRCVLACPLCDQSIFGDTLQQEEIHTSVREHLDKHHTKAINRVYYVYKSKFCTNAFRSKDELRAHHDREHRRDNHYRSKSCSLQHTVLAAQQKFAVSATSDYRLALITIPILLTAEEQREASSRDVPTVSSILDKTLFPDLPSSVNAHTGQVVTMVDGVKVDTNTGEVLSSPEESVGARLEASVGGSNSGVNSGPHVCYRCGMTHTERKKHKRHVRGCTGEIRERVCRVCQNSFKGESFVLHCRYHMQQGIILCMLCNGAQFDTLDKLHSHFEKHAHEQFVYPAVCPFCSIVMPDVPSSLAHLKEKHHFLMGNIQDSASSLVNSSVLSAARSSPTTVADFTVSCEKCGRKFSGGRALAVHVASCMGPNIFTSSIISGTSSCSPAVSGASLPCLTGSTSSSIRQCLACKRVLTQETIGKHMASHLQEGFVVCGLCDGKPIASSLDLLHHLEAHTNTFVYPYSCVMCQLKLEDSESALRHLKEEHGLGHLPCPECDMSYTFSQQLSRHTEIVHRICLYSKRRYICWICRAYDHVKKETLMNHFQIAHGLLLEQVNEKAMIRTRGQGTMPTAQFVPTKQINKKKYIKSPGNSASCKNVTPASDKSPSSSNFSSPENKIVLNIKEEVTVVKLPTVDAVAATVLPESPPQTDNSVEDVPPPASKCSNVTGNNSSGTGTSNSAKKIQKIIRVDIKEAILKQKVTKVKIEEATNSNKAPKPINKGNTISHIGSSCSSSSTNAVGSDVVQHTSKPQVVKVCKRKSADVLSDSEPTEVRKVTSQQQPERKKKCKAHKCDECNFATNFLDKLARHKQRHQDGAATAGYLCRECGQSFVVHQSLVRHMFFAHKIKMSVHGGREREQLGGGNSGNGDEGSTSSGNGKRGVSAVVGNEGRDKVGKRVRLLDNELKGKAHACESGKIMENHVSKVPPSFGLISVSKSSFMTDTKVNLSETGGKIFKVERLSCSEEAPSHKMAGGTSTSQPSVAIKLNADKISSAGTAGSAVQKVTVLNVTPKPVGGEPVKAGEVKSLLHSHHIIPKTIVISKPVQVQPSLTKPPNPSATNISSMQSSSITKLHPSSSVNVQPTLSKHHLNINSTTNSNTALTSIDKVRVPIKITSSSIVSVLSDKLNTPPAIVSVSALGTTAAAKSAVPSRGNQISSAGSVKVITSITQRPPSTDGISGVVVRRQLNCAVGSGNSEVLVTQQTTRSAPSHVSTTSQVVAASQSLLSLSQAASPTTDTPASQSAVVVTKSVVPAMQQQQQPTPCMTVSSSSMLVQPSKLEASAGPPYQCCVCREEFSNATEQYSHMRTHGMAFLKLGRSKWALGGSRVGSGEPSPQQSPPL